jgi:hypothetical protein
MTEKHIASPSSDVTLTAMFELDLTKSGVTTSSQVSPCTTAGKSMTANGNKSLSRIMILIPFV